MARPWISVVIASDRSGPELAGCLRSLEAQEDAPPFEVLVASGTEPPPSSKLLVGWIRSPDRNPALRRNRAVDFAAGEWLAFLDDDARAAPDWLARCADASKRANLFGGRDLLPPGAPVSERISDLLLATPWIGSNVAAHEKDPGPGPVRRPSDLALCNLFVSRTLFDSLGGFDESLGYIGEDTDFVARAIAAGERPEIDPGIVVFHDRRKFPAAFLRQRWRYRWKTGRLLVSKPSAVPRGLVSLFLSGGLAVGALGVLLGRRFLGIAAGAYAIATWTLSFPIWRRDPVLFPLTPLAFAIHHANYWIATVAGALSGGVQAVFRRGSPSRPPVAKAAR